MKKEKRGAKKYLRRRGGDSILTKRSKSERVIFSIVFVFFSIYALSLIYPLIYLFINSFQSSLGYLKNLAGEGGGPFSLPTVWHPENYLTALRGMAMVDSWGRKIYLPEMFFNSIWYSFFNVAGQILMSACTGYALYLR